MTYAMSGRTPAHTEYSSLLLMLLFIFLKVRNRECWSHDRTRPNPSSQENQAKFPVPDSSALAGLELQGCITRSYGVDLCFFFTPFSEKRGEGGP